MQGAVQAVSEASRAKHANANYERGLTLQRQGNYSASIVFFENAIRADPSRPDLFISLGISFLSLEYYQACIVCLRKAILLEGGDNCRSWAYLGVGLQKLKRYAEAVHAFEKAFALGYKGIEVEYKLGLAYRSIGQLEKAIDVFSSLVSRGKQEVSFLNMLGICRAESGDHLGALECYQRTIGIDRKFSSGYYNLANSLVALGMVDKAEEFYKQAISYQISFSAAKNNLANLLKMQKKFDEAVALLSEVIADDKTFIEAYVNLGSLYCDIEEPHKALDVLEAGLGYDNSNPYILYNLGNAYALMQDYVNAISMYGRAIENKQGYADAHWNRGLLLLKCGDYKEGFSEYEWRARLEKKPLLPHALPKCAQLICGDLHEPNKQLLVVSEQGLGDTLQFCRYIPILRKRFSKVTLCIHEKLHSLVKESGIDDSPITPEEGCQISEGYWMSLLSVAGYLGVTPSSPLVNIPYLRARDSDIEKWRQYLSQERKPIVGLNWKGRTSAERNGLGVRSYQLEQLKDLSRLRDCSFVSLQKGDGSEELENCSFKDRFVECQPLISSIWDFSETAAIIKNCSLIITNDTSVAHLAGGLGVKTWLMLIFDPEWRWGTEGSETFWYPNMKIFRQRIKGDWSNVLEELRSEFSNLSI